MEDPVFYHYFLKVWYDGQSYSGSQYQPAQRTVDGAIVDALRELGYVPRGAPHTEYLKVAGRTDKGVSALAAVYYVRVIKPLHPGEVNDRLKSGAPAIMQVATTIGIIWAGSLIAGGMVSNAGIAPVVALYAQDPAQAALSWQSIESVASGLGNGNGEILGGLWTLLVSLAALRAGGLPKGLNILGLLVGTVGIISIAPGLTDLTGVFGLSQIVWFVWLGIVLLRSNPARTA